MTYDSLRANPHGYQIQADKPDASTEGIFLVGSLTRYSPRMLRTAKFPCRVCDHAGVNHEHMLGLDLVDHLSEAHDQTLLSYCVQYADFLETSQLPEKRLP